MGFNSACSTHSWWLKKSSEVVIVFLPTNIDYIGWQKNNHFKVMLVFWENLSILNMYVYLSIMWAGRFGHMCVQDIYSVDMGFNSARSTHSYYVLRF